MKIYNVEDGIGVFVGTGTIESLPDVDYSSASSILAFPDGMDPEFRDNENRIEPWDREGIEALMWVTVHGGGGHWIEVIPETAWPASGMFTKEQEIGGGK